MTLEEYNEMEYRVASDVLALLSSGIADDSISIIMSRDVYEAAKVYYDRVRIKRSVDMRLTCFGKDVYVISQEGVRRTFAPVISRFPLEQGSDYESLDAGTFLISESDDGSLCVYAKEQGNSSFFRDTGLTVRKAIETARVETATSHLWQPAASRSTIFERWLLEEEAEKKREEREKAAAKPDTKELDEFLASFKVLCPAT